MLADTGPQSRIVALVTRWRVFLLLVSVILVALAIEPALRLHFDRNIESMFPPGDERLEQYQQSKELFGGLEACVVAYADPKLFTLAGLERVKQLAERLGQVPHVRGVLSLVDARLPSAPLDARPLTAQVREGSVSPPDVKRQLLESKLYRGTLLGQDGQTTAIVVQLVPASNPEVSRDEVVAQVRDIAADHSRRYSTKTVVAGEPVLIEDVYRHLEEDGQRLGIASSLLLTLVIALLFRNLRWVLLPLVVVHGALFWTKALLVVSGMRLTMVSSPLVALVTVIGVATVIHITMRFREERSFHAPEASLRYTAAAVGPAVFWTCMTTAAGFGSLLASRVVPVQNFGAMMAIGSVLVFAAAAGFVPGGALLGRYATDPGRTPGEGRLDAWLNRVISGVQRHPWVVAGTSATLLGATGIGCFRLQVATDFQDNFRESSPIVQSYDFLAERLGAVAAVDVMVDSPAKPTAPFFEKLKALQNRFATPEFRQAGVVESLSILDLMDLLERGQEQPTGLLQRFTGVLRQVPLPLRLELLRQSEQFRTISSIFWNQGRNVMRVQLRLKPPSGAGAKKRLIEEITAAARQEFPEARVSGVFILLTYLVESLLSDQWKTFALAVCGIFVMMTVAFRSWRLGLVALVPNAAPILIVVGAMGWSGLPVNMATAMIASVSMGLAVDFSIHYLYRVRHELSAGKDAQSAMRAAHRSVGRAMVLANVALIAGFSVLLLSRFIPTVHFGMLVSVAMLGGLLGNLIILPLLLTLLPAFRASGRSAERAP